MANYLGNLKKNDADFDNAVLRDRDCSSCGNVQGFEGMAAVDGVFLSTIVTATLSDDGAFLYSLADVAASPPAEGSKKTAVAPALIDSGDHFIVTDTYGEIEKGADTGRLIKAKQLNKFGIYNLAVQAGTYTQGQQLDVSGGFGVSGGATFQVLAEKTLESYGQVAVKLI